MDPLSMMNFSMPPGPQDGTLRMLIYFNGTIIQLLTAISTQSCFVQAYTRAHL